MSKHLLIWLLASPWDTLRGLITSTGSHRDGGALSAALPSSQPLPWDIPVLGKRASRQETPPKGSWGGVLPPGPAGRAGRRAAPSCTCRTRGWHHAGGHTEILCPCPRPLPPSSGALGTRALSGRLCVPSSGCAYTCGRRYVRLRLYTGMWEQVHSSQIIGPGSSCPRNPIQGNIPG